ncbi:hypothetical protein [Yoonia sp.]|uniref:hypothetical protein n=1 Tax=Yoonia sp. TaxID=2212373 RepID=UPI00391AC60A
MDKVQIWFFDGIVTPWRSLMELVSAHPIAANPDSNRLTVTAEMLATSLRHFKERHANSAVSSVWISEELVEWANSIKHATENGRKHGGKDLAEETVFCFVSPTYEHKDDTFRFIRNEITCTYPLAQRKNAGREFSATEIMWVTIKNYADALGLDVDRFAPAESSYGFLPVAVAFHLPEYAAFTKDMRIKIFAKCDSGYEPVDPSTIRLEILGSEHLTSDLSKITWASVQAEK